MVCVKAGSVELEALKPMRPDWVCTSAPPCCEHIDGRAGRVESADVEAAEASAALVDDGSQEVVLVFTAEVSVRVRHRRVPCREGAAGAPPVGSTAAPASLVCERLGSASGL